MVVAGRDALSEPRENILTRRANQRHYSIIAQFAKRPLVKTSKARATGAFTRTDLRTGAMMMGAFIQPLLSGFSASSLNAAKASSQKVSSQSRNSISPSRRSE